MKDFHIIRDDMNYTIARPDGKMYLGTSHPNYDDNWTDNPAHAFNYSKAVAESRINTFNSFFKFCTIKELA